MHVSIVRIGMCTVRYVRKYEADLLEEDKYSDTLSHTHEKTSVPYDKMHNTPLTGAGNGLL